MKIGAITIGQTPRDDVTCDILPLLGDSVTLLQAGGLNGLTREEIEAMKPDPGDYILITRLRDKSSVQFAEKWILPRLQVCIDQLESQGAELILFFCTGKFPDCFHSRVPLLFPCQILDSIVPLLAGSSRIGVITPMPEQIPQAVEKWEGLVNGVKVTSASPYGEPKELEKAALMMKEESVSLIVLDCIGYTVEMKRKVERLSKKPVILSRTLLARIVGELTEQGSDRTELTEQS